MWSANQSRASSVTRSSVPGLLEEVGGAGDHLQPALAVQPGPGLPVEFEDLRVGAADDEQRGGRHRAQPGSGEVGPAAAETTAAGRASGSAAAHSAAAAPVLAPK